MKRKPVYPSSAEALEKLTTRQLLVRLESLRQCEESLDLSDRDAADDSGAIEFKDSPAWTTACLEVKRELSNRGHVPKGAELQAKRTLRGRRAKSTERRGPSA